MHAVIGLQLKAQLCILCPASADQRLRHVARFYIPTVIRPAKEAIHPEAHPHKVSQQMIFQTHFGIKEISDVHLVVKGDGDTAVAYNRLSGHSSTPEIDLIIIGYIGIKQKRSLLEIENESSEIKVPGMAILDIAILASLFLASSIGKGRN